MSWRSILKAGKKALPFAVLVGVALLLVLFRHELRHHLHRAIAVEETPVSIESVQSLGELVTAASQINERDDKSSRGLHTLC